MTARPDLVPAWNRHLRADTPLLALSGLAVVGDISHLSPGQRGVVSHVATWSEDGGSYHDEQETAFTVLCLASSLKDAWEIWRTLDPIVIKDSSHERGWTDTTTGVRFEYVETLAGAQPRGDQPSWPYVIVTYRAHWALLP